MRFCYVTSVSFFCFVFWCVHVSFRFHFHVMGNSFEAYQWSGFACLNAFAESHAGLMDSYISWLGLCVFLYLSTYSQSFFTRFPGIRRHDKYWFKIHAERGRGAENEVGRMCWIVQVYWLPEPRNQSKLFIFAVFSLLLHWYAEKKYFQISRTFWTPHVNKTMASCVNWWNVRWKMPTIFYGISLKCSTLWKNGRYIQISPPNKITNSLNQMIMSHRKINIPIDDQFSQGLQWKI